MSLFFYGVCILGAVLGGLVLVVLYSLLVMAQRGRSARPRGRRTASAPRLQLASRRARPLDVPQLRLGQAAAHRVWQLRLVRRPPGDRRRSRDRAHHHCRRCDGGRPRPERDRRQRSRRPRSSTSACCSSGSRTRSRRCCPTASTASRSCRPPRSWPCTTRRPRCAPRRTPPS